MKAFTSLFLILFLTHSIGAAEDYQSLYRSAQRDFTKKNYISALEKFDQYVKNNKGVKKADKDRLFWSIDHIARIYIRQNKNPEQIIKFFNSFENDKRLNEVQFDTIQEWKAALNDWKKNYQTHLKAKGESLYNIGTYYYNAGIKRNAKIPMGRGNIEFSIANTFLSKYIFEHPKGDKISHALYMLGDIKSSLVTDWDYWSENFYLKELILRFPHSDMAFKGWEKLYQDTHFGYTGSSGDNTPEEIEQMLGRMKKMARPNKVKKTPKVF
jgi:hypothetical protein